MELPLVREASCPLPISLLSKNFDQTVDEVPDESEAKDSSNKGPDQLGTCEEM